VQEIRLNFNNIAETTVIKTNIVYMFYGLMWASNIRRFRLHIDNKMKIENY
jgi:hypothetical protein